MLLAKVEIATGYLHAGFFLAETSFEVSIVINANVASAVEV